MARNVRTTFLYVVASIVFIVSLYNHLHYEPISISLHDLRFPPLSVVQPNQATIHDDDIINIPPTASQLPPPPGSIPTVSFLFPAWEVLLVVSPEIPVNLTNGDYFCHFNTKETIPAKPAGFLRNPTRKTLVCQLPPRVRRKLPFYQPILTTSKEPPVGFDDYPWTEMLRWNHVVYDSFTTEDDVVLFVKGMNTRQGINRKPTEFRCVFGEGDDAVRTSVTSSLQEVFRCERPNLTAMDVNVKVKVKVWLEVIENNHVVPSLAYYTPPLRKLVEKSNVCACTMVYNVEKFLKEWVVYHSKIGVEKFVLYDNGSDDDLGKVVNKLVDQGYNVETMSWLWPKTQEAGFSHCSLHANDSCNWMAYIDVDEFIYSPTWSNISQPSNLLLHGLLPEPDHHPDIGQLMIGCNEFGPSHQNTHPVEGVVQGYNCRKKIENRHKSIVKLDAVDHSLLNVIHHFRVKQGYKVKKINALQAVVNHYKFQAWPEFKAKFRRRVSAYVIDWTVSENPNSNDRTPGLGFAAVEPQGWTNKFCEVYDDGLKNLTRRWFGIQDSPLGYHMLWQQI